MLIKKGKNDKAYAIVSKHKKLQRKRNSQQGCTYNTSLKDFLLLESKYCELI